MQKDGQNLPATEDFIFLQNWDLNSGPHAGPHSTTSLHQP
jgi:hypothetical protein